MYPPSQYARLPTGPEGEYGPPAPVSKLRRIFARRSLLRTLTIGFGAFLLLLLFGGIAKKTFFPFKYAIWSPSGTKPKGFDWPWDSFGFAWEPKPAWLLEAPAGGPLVLHIAVVSRVDEFDRRQAIRETMFTGVRASDVVYDYKFFVGAPKEGPMGWPLHVRLTKENKDHGDVVVLDDIPDIPERLSEKRYAALKWAGKDSSKNYDYFFTLDSDTYVRLGALARRLPVFFAGQNIKPREQPILLSRMGVHWVHYLNTVPDGNTNVKDEDEYIRGPWYDYPMGIGYMISSKLMDIFLSTTPALPHHIHYPSDDVMLGAWTSSLRLFPNKTIEFETTEPHLHGEPVHKVVPTPFLPEVINTNMVDDRQGWHNFIGRGDHDATFSWSSVCIHHVSAEEMRAFRRIEEIQGEWE